jgi:hypothetical protein
MKKRPEEMGAEELGAELARLRDALRDLEETHSFHLSQRTAHLGSERFTAMHEEYENDRRDYLERIGRVEALLKEKSRK